MINIIHRPVNEIFVGDLIQESLENFLYTCKISMIPNAIWVDGVIIVLSPSFTSDNNIERFFEGKRMYDSVVFVKYPQYTKTVKHNGDNFEFPLRNYENYTRFKEFVKWIKLQPEWNKIPEAIE